MENRQDRLEQYWKQLEDFGLERSDYPDARLRQYRRGEFLCRQGCPMEELLFVVEGRVKVCAVTPADKTLLFCYNGPGTLVGEVELMTGEAVTTSLQADGTVRCVALPMKKYAASLRGNIRFMNRVAHMLAQIVARNAVNDTFNILAPLEARLRAYIAHSQRQGVFAGRLTETAEYLGVSYRHLLRTMNDLCARGILEKTRGGYRILQPLELDREQEEGEWSVPRTKE